MKEQILDFLRDHWQHFGAYPMEIETDNEILTWDQYWSFVSEDELGIAKADTKPDIIGE